MYSLLVSHFAEDLSTRDIEVPRDRFLEYTDDPISVQLTSLSNEAIAFLTSHPFIIMQEGRGKESVRIVRGVSITSSPGGVGVRFEQLSCDPPIYNDSIWKLRTDLDIEQFEFSRHHLAVKDRDLFKVLSDAGYSFEKDQLAVFQRLPLPAPARSEIIASKKALSAWSHARLDDLLLEMGVSTLSAGREIGTTRDRSDAIIRFVLDNPSATTAEKSLLSAFVVRAATSFPRLNDAESRTSVGVPPAPSQQSEEVQRSPNRVFVVHGQNDTARDNVVAFLSSVGLKGIVLHDQPNMGRHLLTKFIEEAELVTFAVIVMTDDDVGALNGEELSPRARQNVILELGYFLSHLGQQRVCALITPGLETPSDFDGIVYIRMDTKGRWRAELMRELIASGMPVFTNVDVPT
jgi:predicted nucleotide-binding protein